MITEHTKIKVNLEEKFFCQRFWELDYFLEDGGWQNLGKQSLEQAVALGEKLLSSADLDIKKNVAETVGRYKDILASIATHPYQGD